MQMQQEIDALIANELEEGERVLWTDRPHPNSKSSASPTTAFYIMATIFGAIGIMFTLISYILSAFNTEQGISDAVLGLSIPGVVFILLAIIFGLIALVYRPNLKGTVYAITDSRIITATTGRTLIVYSYGKDDIGVLTRIERPDGTGDLIFAANRQLGTYYSGNYSYYGASYGSYGGGTRNVGTWGAAANAGKLLGIANVRDVERIVRRTFK